SRGNRCSHSFRWSKLFWRRDRANSNQSATDTIVSYIFFDQCTLDLVGVFERCEEIWRPGGGETAWFQTQMVGCVLISKCEAMIPQTSSFGCAQEKGEFCASCVVSIHGGRRRSSRAEHWRRHRGGLQIIRCSCLNRDF